MRRWLAVAAGALLALGGLYVVIGEQMAGVSANAVVNAQVLTVRAPVDGVLDLESRRLGTRLRQEERLGAVADPRPDETRLIDLRRAIGLAEADLRRLEDLTNTIVASRAAYVQQAQDYAAGRVEQLQARLAEAAAVQEAAMARQREAEATMRRATDLSRSGIQTAVDFNRARAGFEVGTQEVEAARTRMRFLTIELEAARRGVFLGDSYNDAPSSQQRVRELDQRLGELAAEVRERNQRIGQLEAQLDEERVRLARFRDAALTAPAPGILWEIMAGHGEYVRRGQDVLRLVDCTTTVVTASVRESVYNRLSVGDPVRFRLLGDDRIFEGAVARLAGSGAESIYRSLAVHPSQEHLRGYHVTVMLPVLTEDPILGCAIGRTGRAIFAGRPLDFWRRLRTEFGF